MAVKILDEMTKDELINYINDNNAAMFEHISKLEKELERLKKEIEDHKINEKDLEFQLKIEKEKYKREIAARYQSQQNQIVLDMPRLFDDVEAEAMKAADEEVQEVITVGEHKRIKRPKEKNTDYSNLRREVVTLPVPLGEDICPVCGSKMKIKRYEEIEEIVIIPQDVYMKVTRVPVMICEECQSLNEDGKSTCVTVSHPNSLIPRSKVSPELLAYIIDMKYNCGLPLYTLENMFKRQNIIIPRQNMCNWILGVVRYLEPLYNLMKEDLLKMPAVLADETRTQVIMEKGKPGTSTSYMWVYNSPRSIANIVLYDYQPSRCGDNPKDFLKGFSGYLMTDKYDGYNKVENVIRCYCNMHGLKYFKEAYKLLPNNKNRKTSDEAVAIAKYQAIFHEEDLILEDASKKYSDLDKRFEYIQKRREIKLKPMFEKFFAWLESIESRNAGKYTMSKAINYMLRQREGFMKFIENGAVPISNVASEQNIKPFVVIRNRCKFSFSTRGAYASTLIYSIVITCMQNKINPYMYFTHIFEQLPDMDLNDKEALRELLPYSTSLPGYLKIMSKSEIKAILKDEKK